MAKKSVKQIIKVKQERMILWFLLFLLILLLLLWWAAAHYNWDLGNQKPVSSTSGLLEPVDTTTGAAATSGGTGTSGATGAAGASGAAGSSSTTTTTNPDISTFFASVNNGDTHAQVSGQASGLNQACTATVTSTTAGDQTICVYSQGDKVVTVTYLNDREVNVSKSGF